MSKIRLSIIIPVYNSGKYLEKCISSIKRNKCEEYEIIMIDDGSNDGTSEICDKYSDEFQIKVIHQKNSGVSNARNRGLKLARGEYITFVDSDDYVSPDYVGTIIQKINTQKDIYFFGSNKIEGNKKTKCREWIYRIEDRFNIERIYDVVLSGKSNEPWDKVFKKRIIDENNIKFNVNVGLGEDIIFTLDYLKYVKSCELIKKDIYNYRILFTGLSRKPWDIGVLENRDALFLKMIELIECKHLENDVKEHAYSFMLQIIVNCRGKLFKNDYSSKE
ncbi:MAG: glycosyltransferase, partial [Eubacterium ventriosum]|nr:glycosyltransferase [Eubacterium ventriosum]